MRSQNPFGSLLDQFWLILDFGLLLDFDLIFLIVGLIVGPIVDLLLGQLLEAQALNAWVVAFDLNTLTCAQLFVVRQDGPSFSQGRGHVEGHGAAADPNEARTPHPLALAPCPGPSPWTLPWPWPRPLTLVRAGSESQSTCKDGALASAEPVAEP